MGTSRVFAGLEVAGWRCMKGSLEEAVSVLMVVLTSLVLLHFSYNLGMSHLQLCKEQNKAMLCGRLLSLMDGMPRRSCVKLPSCASSGFLNFSGEYYFAGEYLCRG